MSKKRKPKLDDKLCENCGRYFEPARYWQRFCTQRCRLANFWTQEAEKIKALDPLDAMMAEPLTGPTPGQEAERLRRKQLSEEQALKQFEPQTDLPPQFDPNIRVDIAERSKEGRVFVDTNFGSGSGYDPPKKED